MRKDLTALTIVLDRSGSMASCYDDTLGGFNTFVDSQRSLPGVCEMTLFQFNDTCSPFYMNTPLEHVSKLSQMNYIPGGGTALYDALAHAIDSAGKHYAALPPKLRPGKVIFAIITDGGENSSHLATREQVFAKIAHQQSVYNWQFAFIGANQDAYAVAGGIGIMQASALNYAQTVKGTQKAYGSLSRAVCDYREEKTAGGIIFSAAEQSTLE